MVCKYFPDGLKTHIIAGFDGALVINCEGKELNPNIQFNTSTNGKTGSLANEIWK